MATGQQGPNSGTSTFSMSMGLASILNERDLLPTAAKKKNAKLMTETATNPERVDSIVSDSHFEFSKITASSTYTTTTECSTKLSTGQAVSPQDSGFSGSNSSDSSGSMNLPFSLQRGLPFDHLNQGTHVLMDTLKHTGYSLINSRYIGGMLRPHNREGTSSASSSASCEQTTTSSTADKSDVIHVTAGKISKTEASKISSLFGRALPGGVSGALTQLRQNGIFWMRESFLGLMTDGLGSKWGMVNLWCVPYHVAFNHNFITSISNLPLYTYNQVIYLCMWHFCISFLWFITIS